MSEAKLRIKSPSANLPDIYLEVALNDTILHVKQLIRDNYSQHPEPKDQKLVYSGRLLQDHELVKNVLRFEDDCVHYTIHLVCKIKEHQSSTANSSSRSSSEVVTDNTSLSTPSANHESVHSDGIRQRHTLVPEEGSAADFQQVPTTQQPFFSYSNFQQHSTRPQTEEEIQLESINRTLQDLITQSPNMSASELAVYQQVYMQYISLNTQFLQQGGAGGNSYNNIAATPINGNVEAVANAVNNNNIGDAAGGEMVAAAPANENVAAPAGVDPLEYAYSILRIAILFCIMYSHSSFFRLLFVILALAGVYFLRNRNQEAQAANNNNNIIDNNNIRQQNNAIEEQHAEGVTTENAPNAAQIGDEDTSEEVTEQVEQEPKPNILSVAFTFVSTLVSSILPDNANLIQ